MTGSQFLGLVRADRFHRILLRDRRIERHRVTRPRLAAARDLRKGGSCSSRRWPARRRRAGGAWARRRRRREPSGRQSSSSPSSGFDSPIFSRTSSALTLRPSGTVNAIALVSAATSCGSATGNDALGALAFGPKFSATKGAIRSRLMVMASRLTSALQNAEMGFGAARRRGVVEPPCPRPWPSRRVFLTFVAAPPPPWRRRVLPPPAPVALTLWRRGLCHGGRVGPGVVGGRSFDRILFFAGGRP